ncbi:hypothetical protein HK102_003736 [Quaeritorhiza haematococci]|nr:hypothetical protein HK102_003736 [Quaeritorhiza haematococci]
MSETVSAKISTSVAKDLECAPDISNLKKKKKPGPLKKIYKKLFGIRGSSKKTKITAKDIGVIKDSGVSLNLEVPEDVAINNTTTTTPPGSPAHDRELHSQAPTHRQVESQSQKSSPEPNPCKKGLITSSAELWAMLESEGLTYDDSEAAHKHEHELEHEHEHGSESDANQTSPSKEGKSIWAPYETPREYTAALGYSPEEFELLKEVRAENLRVTRYFAGELEVEFDALPVPDDHEVVESEDVPAEAVPVPAPVQKPGFSPKKLLRPFKVLKLSIGERIRAMKRRFGKDMLMQQQEAPGEFSGLLVDCADNL